MKPLFKSAMGIVGVLFAILVLGFTGFQTWSLLYTVSENPYIATLGLILFEGGMLYWWAFFLKSAEGLGQMALSLLAALFGLLLVGGATALHLGAVDPETFGATTPAKLITAAAIINLAVKFVMPLLHPDVLRTTWEKSMEGIIVGKAYQAFQTKTNDIAAELADDMTDEWVADLRILLANKYRSRRSSGVVIEGAPAAAAVPGPGALQQVADAWGLTWDEAREALAAGRERGQGEAVREPTADELLTMIAAADDGSELADIRTNYRMAIHNLPDADFTAVMLAMDDRYHQLYEAEGVSLDDISRRLDDDPTNDDDDVIPMPVAAPEKTPLGLLMAALFKGDKEALGRFVESVKASEVASEPSANGQEQDSDHPLA